MNKKQSMLDTLEWHPLPSGGSFYDELERRIFVNGSKNNIKLGFGHDIRRRETILITLEKDEIADPKLKSLEGEIVVEEDYNV